VTNLCPSQKSVTSQISWLIEKNIFHNLIEKSHNLHIKDLARDFVMNFNHSQNYTSQSTSQKIMKYYYRFLPSKFIVT